MGWVELNPETYRGPLVRVRIGAPRSLTALDGLALLDTGATHTIIDVDRVARPLGLQPTEHDRMRFAGTRPATEVPIFQASLFFPDFPLAPSARRVAGAHLPDHFLALIGMDLLKGTRLTLHWGDDGLWIRWTPLDSGSP